MNKRLLSNSTKQDNEQHKTLNQQTMQTKKNRLTDLIGSIKDGENFDTVKDKQDLYK